MLIVATSRFIGDKTAVQQQAILRNGPSAITALTNLIVATIRSSTTKRWDNIALSAWALANFVAFLAAGILSSRVANTTPDVLLQSTHCGRWWKFGFGGSLGFTANNAKQFQETGLEAGAVENLHFTSSQFRSTCYEDDNPKPREGCLPFVRNPISWTSTMGSACPFGDGICSHDTFTIESEWIESGRHLGINTDTDDQVTMQMRKSCSPLKADGYTKPYDSENISKLIDLSKMEWSRPMWKNFLAGDHKYLAFFYGPVYGLLGSGNEATFVYSNASLIPAFNEPPPIYSLVYVSVVVFVRKIY